MTDFSCTYPGCTNPASLNYSPGAGCDDGSCGLLPVLYLASQQNYCNGPNSLFLQGEFYAPTVIALVNGVPSEITSSAFGTELNCLVPPSIPSGELNILVVNAQGVSNTVYLTLSIYGCTNPVACNFDSNAACDDGSCVLEGGCTDALACNFDPTQLCDDGTCEYASCTGCTYPDASNYSGSATQDDGSCTFDLGTSCMGDLNDDDEISSADLLVVLGVFGTVCP